MTDQEVDLTSALAISLMREIRLFLIANGQTEDALNMVLRAMAAVTANLVPSR